MTCFPSFLFHVFSSGTHENVSATLTSVASSRECIRQQLNIGSVRLDFIDPPEYPQEEVTQKLSSL